MKRIILLLFLRLSQVYSEEECDYHKYDNLSEFKVHEKLMCHMYNEVPPKPQNGSDAVIAYIGIIVKKFDFDSREQEFSVHTWTSMTWRDERLKWDPSEFGGVDETIVMSIKLPWMPGVKLCNSISDDYDQRHDYNINCFATMSGLVDCISQLTFVAKCITDVSDWPFDTQVCSLEFGTWTDLGVKVRLNFIPERAVMFIGSEYGAEWDVMDYRQEEDEDAKAQLKAYFTLARHAGSLAAMVVYPSLALSVLTVSALFLDARRDTRLLVGSFSLACHFYCLTQLNSVVPVHSTSTPKILFYFRGSLILTFISFVLTFWLKHICKRRAWVPNVIEVANEFVYKSYAKDLIIPRWETASNVGDNGEKQAWTDFANVLNAVWILVSCVIYIVIYCVCVPLPSGLTMKVPTMSFLH